MAVTAATQPLLKSQPDMSKINGFTGCTVTVTKHQQARNTPGSSIVTTRTMTKEQLLALQDSLLGSHGPGYFLFSVVDAGGSGEDSWMIKLGADVVPQEGYPMAGPTFGAPPFTQAPQPPGVPLDPEIKQIMPGFFYNEALGYLYTPWRDTVPWRTGDPWPKAPTTAGHLAAVPQNATPWNWPPQQQGWGGYPVSGGSSELDAVKAELLESKRQREMDELRADQRRRDDERERREAERVTEDRRREEERARREEQRREEDRRREELRTKEMAELIAKLTAKPAGPSEAEQRLERSLEEEKRRREENEREARRVDQERIAEDRRQREMRETNEKFERALKEAAGNKIDPMMILFKEIITSQQVSSAATVQSIKDSAAATAAVAERNAISPAQIFDMVARVREGANESSKTVMETMKGLMDTQKEVMTSMIDLAGTGNQPWYAGAIQEGLNKVGMIGTALAERAQQQQQQAPIVQQRRVVPAPQPQVAQPAVAGQIPQAPRAVVTSPPVGPALAGRAAHTGDRPGGTVYLKDKDEFVLSDGRHVANTVVQSMGWAGVLAMPQYEPGAPAFPAGQAPPIGLVPPVAAPHTNGAMKPKKKRGGAVAVAPAAAPVIVPEVVSTALPPPANGSGYSLAELRDFEPDQIRIATNPYDDATLFGALASSITDLRVRVSKGMPAEKAAEAVLGSRQYLSSFGGVLPPAFELLAAEHYEVLVERLLPEAGEEYQAAVAEAIERILDAEGGGGGDEEEEGAEVPQ